MGRGRQKAKQTKVARELKYHTSSIDVSALQRELGNSPLPPMPVTPEPESDDEDDDPYAAYYEDDEDDDESSDYASPQRGR
jgi:hypothetical protein